MVYRRGQRNFQIVQHDKTPRIRGSRNADRKQRDAENKFTSSEMIGEIDSTYWKPIQENLNNIRRRRKSEEPKPEDVEPPSQRFAATMNGKKMPTRDAVEKKKNWRIKWRNASIVIDRSQNWNTMPTRKRDGLKVNTHIKLNMSRRAWVNWRFCNLIWRPIIRLKVG